MWHSTHSILPKNFPHDFFSTTFLLHILLFLGVVCDVCQRRSKNSERIWEKKLKPREKLSNFLKLQFPKVTKLMNILSNRFYFHYTFRRLNDMLWQLSIISFHHSQKIVRSIFLCFVFNGKLRLRKRILLRSFSSRMLFCFLQTRCWI